MRLGLAPSVASLALLAAGLPAGVTVPHGFAGEIIANVPRARELAIAPNGDLFVGTEGTAIYLVPHADAAGAAGRPLVFWQHPDSDRGGDAPNAGVTFVPQEHLLYVGSNTGVWMLGYRPGTQHALWARRIARVRTGGIPPGSDGDVHETTSVAFTRGSLYVSVGSSCNACTEIDPTRAVVLKFSPLGGRYVIKATRIRNAIALAVDPASGGLWVAGAGQDDLPFGHPYEYADDLSAHTGTADYGWPECEEHHVAYVAGARCASTVVPLVELPAYSTIIGATFYPRNQEGPYAFPSRYRGTLFLAAHGSWHRNSQGTYAAVPQVVYVPMHGDKPAKPVNWSDPSTQWRVFFGGFQQGANRVGRPTGIAVGPRGSLFVADDRSGNIYRIRPTP
jgi:glucose/arabinose dehydrogenase